MATALRQEVRRRDIAEARSVTLEKALEAAQQALSSQALAKDKAAAAAAKQALQRYSLLQAQLTAAATERKRLAAREQPLAEQNTALAKQLETAKLRVAALSSERANHDRRSQTSIDQARSGEAEAVKAGDRKKAAAQAGLESLREEVSQLHTQLDTEQRKTEDAQRTAERAEQEARAASTTAIEAQRQLHVLRQRSMATVMNALSSSPP